MEPTSIYKAEIFQKLQTKISSYKNNQSTPLYDVEYPLDLAYFVDKK